MAFVLIGFMGAGKSTVAARLAEERGVSPLDSDALLAQRFGHPVARELRAARRGVVPGGRGGARLRSCWPMPVRAR